MKQQILYFGLRDLYRWHLLILNKCWWVTHSSPFIPLIGSIFNQIVGAIRCICDIMFGSKCSNLSSVALGALGARCAHLLVCSFAHWRYLTNMCSLAHSGWISLVFLACSLAHSGRTCIYFLLARSLIQAE